MTDQPQYWAMRTNRDCEEHRTFLCSELLEKGNLRQGWGGHDDQDLSKIEAAWEEGKRLNDRQQGASRHRRMGNGDRPDYMYVDDIVLVPNMSCPVPYAGTSSGTTAEWLAAPYGTESGQQQVAHGALVWSQSKT